MLTGGITLRIRTTNIAVEAQFALLLEIANAKGVPSKMLITTHVELINKLFRKYFKKLFDLKSSVKLFSVGLKMNEGGYDVASRGVLNAIENT